MVGSTFIRNFFVISIMIACSSCGYQFEKLTIVTCPVGHAETWSHFAVTRSIRNGLRKIGVNFNYNPSSLEEVGDVLWVLTDINALQQGINAKKSGKIKKLLAGPNLMVRSNESHHILAGAEIDACIVPSDWVKVAYIEDEPSLANRIAIWFSGVDVDWLCPVDTLKNKKNNVLVYWKTESESACIQVEQILKKYHWNPIRIKYGSYNQEQYRKLLSQVTFAVFLSRSESQGLALVEAWAMDIPVLVWDPQKPLVIQNKVHNPVSSAPYLTTATGIFWTNNNELEVLVKNIKDNLQSFNPRLWVLSNMSDEVSAREAVSIISKL